LLRAFLGYGIRETEGREDQPARSLPKNQYNKARPRVNPRRLLGLIAFRLCWIAPFAARLGLLPRSWQRWIFGEPNAKKPNGPTTESLPTI